MAAKRAAVATVTWHEHACAYVQMKMARPGRQMLHPLDRPAPIPAPCYPNQQPFKEQIMHLPGCGHKNPGRTWLRVGATSRLPGGPSAGKPRVFPPPDAIPEDCHTASSCGSEREAASAGTAIAPGGCLQRTLAECAFHRDDDPARYVRRDRLIVVDASAVQERAAATAPNGGSRALGPAVAAAFGGEWPGGLGDRGPAGRPAPVASRWCGRVRMCPLLPGAVMKMVSSGGPVSCRSHRGCARWLTGTSSGVSSLADSREGDRVAAADGSAIEHRGVHADVDPVVPGSGAEDS